MFWTILLSSIVVSVSTICFYIKWKYFTLRGSVPGLEPEFPYGNLRQLGIITSKKILADPFIHGFANMQKQYGDIFQFWMGANHFYVFCRPEHAEQIYANRHLFDRADIRTKTLGLIVENAIITLIGPKYKRHAKAVLPMLRKNKFKSQITIMTDCVDHLIII
jgi:cytochrome P450